MNPIGILIRTLAGVMALFAATIVGCVELNSLWSVPVMCGGVFLIFMWVILNTWWADRD